MMESGLEAKSGRKQKTRSWKRWCFLLLIVVQMMAVLWFGHEKRATFCDEAYSYGLANSEAYPFISYDSSRQNNDDEWVTSDYFYDYVVVNSGTPFSFHAAFENQTHDVHPPLYYCLLHLVCSLTPDVFTKWSGIALNFVILLLLDVVLYRIYVYFFRNWKLALLTVLLWSVSSAGLNIEVFIRMYLLMTLEMMALVLINIRIFRDDKKMSWKEAVLILLNVIAGGLTHYYFYVFAGMLALCFLLYLLYHHRWLESIVYAVVHAAGVGLAILIFPATLQHVFSGYRGEEVIQNLQDRGQNVLSSYLQYVNHSVFGYCLIPILVILVLSLITAFHSGELTLHVKTRQGSNSEAILESIHVERSRKPYTGRDYNKLAIAIVLTITSVFFIYVAAVGSQVVDSRYIAPVYPLISMLAVEMLYLIFRNLRFSKFSVPALLVSVALIIRCSLQNDGVMYQSDLGK